MITIESDLSPKYKLPSYSRDRRSSGRLLNSYEWNSSVILGDDIAANFSTLQDDTDSLGKIRDKSMQFKDSDYTFKYQTKKETGRPPVTVRTQ